MGDIPQKNGVIPQKKFSLDNQFPTANLGYGPEVTLIADASYYVGPSPATVETFKNFTALNSANIANGASNGTIRVTGTFTPAGTNFPHVELTDGATLDLSGRTGTCSAASVHSGVTNFITTGAAGTITVNLAGRTDLKTLADSASPYVVTWNGAPRSTMKFVPDAETVAQGLALRVDDTGIRLVRALFMIILR